MADQRPIASKRIGYYPGCALHGSSREYDMSVRAVAQALGHELVEVNDWSCCGASAAHSTNAKLAESLSIRNLALAEKQGLDAILAPCPMCSKQLLVAAESLAEHPAVKAEVEQIIEMPYGGGVRTLNYIQYCIDSLDDLKARVKEPGLGKLKVACYYGCLLTRPPKVLKFDDAEQPVLMETVLQAVGAEPVAWAHRTECCGGGFTQSHEEAVVRLCRRILENAKAAGAEMLAVACPMCQMNLDLRQKAVEKKFDLKLGMPIVYVSQLVGLALGIDRRKLGLDRHFVKVVSC